MDNPNKLNITGILLAGGMSRRLGRDKAIELIAGQPLINRILNVLSQVTQQTLVVVNDSNRASSLPLPKSAKIVTDYYLGKGSLGGIFSGLLATDSHWSIVVACDMPFLNVDLLNYLISQTNDYDAVIPILNNQLQPTHALYSKSCIRHIEEKIKCNNLKITDVLSEMRTNFVPETLVRKFDPTGFSFFNINTQADVSLCQSILSKEHPISLLQAPHILHVDENL